MAMKNKSCLTCGTKYSFCPDCSGADRLAPSWKSEFCSETCMTLWTTCTKYNLGKITKPEAKSIVSALTLKPTEQYVQCVQRDLAVILKEEPKPKRGKRAAAVVVDEVVPVEVKAVVEETIEEHISDKMVAESEPVIAQGTHEVVNETIENE